MLNNNEIEKYKIPYEIEKYIYNFVPIKKCCFCGNHYVNHDEFSYFCRKKCYYIFITGIYAKLFLSLNHYSFQLFVIVIFRLFALFVLFIIYLFIQFITISTGLLIYNFDSILLAHYFIEE